MTTRVHPGRLRRELRFSKTAITANLRELGKDLSEIKPLIEALMSPEGLLGLYGTELLLLERILGIGYGEPAVQLVGELISTKPVPTNTGISYGYLSKTKSPTNIGLVAIGFSDGIPRSATNRFSVEIEGRIYFGVGRIAMDQCVIDLGSESPKPGSEVFFFTEAYSLETFARDTGFSQLEILGRMAERVTRTWAE